MSDPIIHPDRHRQYVVTREGDLILVATHYRLKPGQRLATAGDLSPAKPAKAAK